MVYQVLNHRFILQAYKEGHRVGRGVTRLTLQAVREQRKEELRSSRMALQVPNRRYLVQSRCTNLAYFLASPLVSSKSTTPSFSQQTLSAFNKVWHFTSL
mmetsp:Transcript_17307/g.48219  ORF Transcript_17307/g.48219 Transcript_17307/m.48219 type:complete len:100 (+) Transcript_17307:426-725(+)